MSLNLSFGALSTALGQAVEPLLRDHAPQLLTSRPLADIERAISKEVAFKKRHARHIVPKALPRARPVLQLAEFPIVIDPALYANPRAAANPGGDLRSARAFRDLVDPLPGLSSGYLPSGQSTELIYKAILGGAQTSGSGMASTTLYNARMTFRNSALPGLDGSVINWHLVDASPWKWYDATTFQPVTVSLDQDPGSPFQVVGDAPLRWRVDGTASGPSSASRIEKVTLQCQMVMLSRPWLCTSLFSMSGWSLPPEPAGYCSSGRIDNNSGVLPLLPSALLIGQVNTIVGQWGGSDLEKLASVRSGRSVSLGPFPVRSVARDGALQGTETLSLIGVVSRLMPFSPHA
jgi:hypothetical protein